MEPTLIILRGLPSSGKTTLANMLVNMFNVSANAQMACMFAADDHFNDANSFHFSKLSEAHEQCLMNVSHAMTDDVPLIVVHNTNVARHEIMPYISLAQDNNYRYFVLSLFDGGHSDAELAERNSHGVPVKTIENMRRKFRHDWCSGK